MLRAKLFATVGGAIALAAAFAPGMARADVPPEQVPASLRSAIQQYVESQGHDYAGLCREVIAGPSIPYGEHCAFVLTIQHDIAEVTYAPVATDELNRIHFKNTGGAWSPILPDSPTPTPPPAESELPPGLGDIIEQYIEGQGHEYAGLCIDVNANPPLPFGEYCAFVLSIEHDIAEISYGPVASNDISLVSFIFEGGQWRLYNPQAPSPTPATPAPPTATPTSPSQPTSTPTQPANPTATPTTPATPTIPPALEQAIKERIESIGKEYAGLCLVVNANPPLPFGEYCAFVNSIKDGVADVSYGPVATNEITRVTFRLEGSQWKVVSPATPTKTTVVPLPPSTGNGGQDGDSGTLALGLVVAATLAATGAGAFALRRR